jgi:SAD/SRA domain
MGDTYGNRASGAYSIVVLRRSAYGDIDMDDRSTLYYLGPGSLENTNSKHTKETKDTAALQTSAKKSQAVHIIRGINKAKKTRLSTGFCYDGLGEVVAQEKLQDNQDEAYIRFKLSRMEGQVPIKTSKPSKSKQKAFNKIKLVEYKL